MSSLNGSGHTVELSDGPHVIRFDLNAFSEIEDRFGDLESMKDAMKAKPFSTTRFLLSAALDGVSEEEAGRLAGGVSIQALSDALGAAMNAAVGVDKPGAVDPQVPVVAEATPPATEDGSIALAS